MLEQLQEARRSFPSRSRGMAASETLSAFRREKSSMLEEVHAQTLLQIEEMSNRTSAISALKIKRASESAIRCIEDNIDSMHGYLDPGISEFSKILSADDCFSFGFNSRATVNTIVANFHDDLLREVAEFDCLGNAMEKLVEETRDLEIEVSKLEKTESVLWEELEGFTRSERDEGVLIENFKHEIFRLRAVTTISGSSVEDIQERSVALNREADSVRQELRSLEVDRSRMKTEIAVALELQSKLEREIARIIIK